MRCTRFWENACCEFYIKFWVDLISPAHSEPDDAHASSTRASRSSFLDRRSSSSRTTPGRFSLFFCMLYDRAPETNCWRVHNTLEWKRVPNACMHYLARMLMRRVMRCLYNFACAPPTRERDANIYGGHPRRRFQLQTARAAREIAPWCSTHLKGVLRPRFEHEIFLSPRTMLTNLLEQIKYTGPRKYQEKWILNLDFYFILKQ